MTTIKAYTDLEQSRKLAKILPLESADMYYSSVPVREWKDKEDTSKGTQVVFKSQIFAIENLPNHEIGEWDIYAWSLAALLNILPKIQGDKPVIALDDNYITYPHMSDLHTKADNLVDACVAMIEKIHVLNLL